jgi:hypothetical protein
VLEKGGMVRETARKEAAEGADGEAVASGIYGDGEVAGGVLQNTTGEYKPVPLTRGRERRQRDNPASATPRSAKPGGSTKANPAGGHCDKQSSAGAGQLLCQPPLRSLNLSATISFPSNWPASENPSSLQPFRA